jgi:tellurite methyltransferase
MKESNLQNQFGNIDIYLLDQLFKGTYADCRKVLDLGSGYGRNSYWFLKNGYEVFALDQSEEAIVEFRKMAKAVRPDLSSDHFICSKMDAKMPLEKESFDLIICNAVLHFAESHKHFEEMLSSALGLLKAGGYFFARLASKEGMGDKLIDLGNGRYLLPDESERYLVDDEMLRSYAKQYEMEAHEYIKTTLVEGLRAMTTVCWRKLQV